MTRTRKRLARGAARVRRPRRSAHPQWEDVPRLAVPPPEDPLMRILEEASFALLRHPVAAQAVCAAFVAEGRRFAQTPEGREWQAALANSELVRTGTALWEGSVLNTLEDHPDTLLPSTILDAIAQAMSRRDLLAFLHELQGRIVDAAEPEAS